MSDHLGTVDAHVKFLFGRAAFNGHETAAICEKALEHCKVCLFDLSQLSQIKDTTHHTTWPQTLLCACPHFYGREMLVSTSQQVVERGSHAVVDIEVLQPSKSVYSQLEIHIICD